jgi:branched-chain amino acid transport system ATP-binding protein
MAHQDMTASRPLLELRGLESGYGSAQVLFGIDLSVAEGEVLALMGRNGMGKTTLVRTLLGLCTRMGGQVRLAGEDVTRAPGYRVARAGIGLVPEGRHVFRSLDVEENLLATARPPRQGGGSPWTLERVYEFFPRLAERRHHRGNQLSGGEQQMLAIGRALLTQPRLLVLDEATEGLAPLIREEIWKTLARLKAEGLSVLVVDRDLRALGGLADRYLVLDKGRVVRSGEARELIDRPAVVEELIGVA